MEIMCGSSGNTRVDDYIDVFGSIVHTDEERIYNSCALRSRHSEPLTECTFKGGRCLNPEVIIFCKGPEMNGKSHPGVTTGLISTIPDRG